MKRAMLVAKWLLVTVGAVATLPIAEPLFSCPGGVLPHLGIQGRVP
ncbi:MAG: hypothetical protein QXI60_07790 [Thermofilaceae archaeon]